MVKLGHYCAKQKVNFSYTHDSLIAMNNSSLFTLYHLCAVVNSLNIHAMDYTCRNIHRQWATLVEIYTCNGPHL